MTMCAERNAIFNAVARGEREIQAVVVFTGTAEPSLPCGACRQVIREFGAQIEIRCFCACVRVEQTTIEALLPKAFVLAEGGRLN